MLTNVKKGYAKIKLTNTNKYQQMLPNVNKC